MADLNTLINHLIQTAARDAADAEKERNRVKPVQIAYFKFTRKAAELVEPSKNCACYHREREIAHTHELETAEKDLRENGISTECVDPTTGYAFQMPNSSPTCSGSIGSGAVQWNGNVSSAPKFQARVDQQLLGKVERAKTKMLEHRSLAEKFEHYARAFACAPDIELELSIADAAMFKLKPRE